MKIAITIWNGRVSPLFDSASNVFVYESLNENDFTKKQITFDAQSAEAKADILLQNGIDLLICGAVSSDAERILSQKGIAVFAYLSGEADEIIKMIKTNKPLYENFAMPGCVRKRQCGRMRHRCGKNKL
ncbi:MAG TPA: NifB/NifX family molybdenum-iron cluster-binding protein [Spirochaetota bacterium]|nr:NifB/NifX family molybdenum-iron cluster-binding protein [Spirochaetota bacterium]HOR44571.1 NifB/NifX family molybdenum-iron cluster-binding protein [Spirochaetota bacterium]HPK55986.1 NifB/NifX family molybdenum-iron cluster-binding protein [Spirochaetota bacterium]